MEDDVKRSSREGGTPCEYHEQISRLQSPPLDLQSKIYAGCDDERCDDDERVDHGLYRDQSCARDAGRSWDLRHLAHGPRINEALTRTAGPDGANAMTMAVVDGWNSTRLRKSDHVAGEGGV